MLGLMSRLFAFLAHVQAVQPVAGPFFARWRLASHGDISPCLLVLRATLLFFPAKLYIYVALMYPDVNHISRFILLTSLAYALVKRC